MEHIAIISRQFVLTVMKQGVKKITATTPPTFYQTAIVTTLLLLYRKAPRQKRQESTVISDSPNHTDTRNAKRGTIDEWLFADDLPINNENNSTDLDDIDVSLPIRSMHDIPRRMAALRM